VKALVGWSLLRNEGRLETTQAEDSLHFQFPYKKVVRVAARRLCQPWLLKESGGDLKEARNHRVLDDAWRRTGQEIDETEKTDQEQERKQHRLYRGPGWIHQSRIRLLRL
jgi:hypothetical protein